jgi:hypothetical protein
VAQLRLVRFTMSFPTATRTTAFLAGMSLSALAILLGTLKSRGLVPYDADGPELFPFLAAYFLATVMILVIDVRSVAPKELKTRFPLVYFPTNREGVRFVLKVWGRMLVWFLGAITGIALLAPLAYLLK